MPAFPARLVLLKTTLLKGNLQQVLFLPAVDTCVQRSSWCTPWSPCATDFHGKLGGLWLAILPCCQEDPSQRLLGVTHRGAWATMRGLTVLPPQLSVLLLAYGQLDVSCP